jgi:hypothetical protein
LNTIPYGPQHYPPAGLFGLSWLWTFFGCMLNAQISVLYFSWRFGFWIHGFWIIKVYEWLLAPDDVALEDLVMEGKGIIWRCVLVRMWNFEVECCAHRFGGETTPVCLAQNVAFSSFVILWWKWILACLQNITRSLSK